MDARVYTLLLPARTLIFTWRDATPFLPIICTFASLPLQQHCDVSTYSTARYLGMCVEAYLPINTGADTTRLSLLPMIVTRICCSPSRSPATLLELRMVDNERHYHHEKYGGERARTGSRVYSKLIFGAAAPTHARGARCSFWRENCIAKASARDTRA